MIGQIRHFSLKQLQRAPDKLQVKVGDSAKLQRKFTLEDLQRFGECIGDVQSKDQLYRADIVYGIYSTSLFTTLFRAYFPQAIYLSQEVKFKRPVTVGKDVQAEIVITAQQGKDLTFQTQVSVEGKIAIEGTAKLRIPYLDDSGAV